MVFIMNGEESKNLKLPQDGEELKFSGIEDNNEIIVTIKNWKGARYYFTCSYQAQKWYKTKDMGYIACDGSGWNLQLIHRPNWAKEFIRSLYPIIGGDIAED